ncbi:MAG TPA: hypothetical protein VFO86_06275 [Terriglobia bacterium]|nr:hypothetical protein [Terriglobia bacterium]
MNIGKFPYRSFSCQPIPSLGLDMKKLLLNFLLFLGALWGLGQISLPIVITGIGLAMALVAVMHIALTPENY